MSFLTCDSLDDYLSTYAVHLGRKANDLLRPLHVPGVDPGADTSAFLRAPFPAQEHCISGMVEAWKRSNALIVCGEMGTGKTLIGQCGVHAHAVATGKTSLQWVGAINLRKPVTAYRALVMCPNHLIAKWKREILATVPHARVVTFERSDANRADDSYMEVCRYIREQRSKWRKYQFDRARPGNDRNRNLGRQTWEPAKGPEFVIIGQNQSKHDGGWAPIAKPSGKLARAGTLRTTVIADEVKYNSSGRPEYDARGKQLRVRTTAKLPRCPRCGQPVIGPKGLLIEPEAMHKREAGQMACEARYLQEVATADRPSTGLDRIGPAPACYKSDPDGHRVELYGRTYELRTCGEPLWQFTPTPRKYPPATIFKLKARGLFDYFLLDEMHEEQSATSARSIAAAKMMTCAKKLVGLTGTLIGGYAHHLFPLLMRMAPKSIVASGFGWSDSEKFAKVYGKIETVVTTRFDKAKTSRTRRRNTNSLRKSDDSEVKETVKPGIMPSLYGHHLIGKALFVSLSEMEDDLPALLDDDRSLIPVAMDPELAEGYRYTATTLAAAVDELLRKGSKKLLGTFQQTLLGYPDMPYDWRGPYEGKAAIGYWEDSKHKTEDNYIGVVTPPSLDPGATRAKEQALVDLCMDQYRRGRKVWVYCQMTDKRDVQVRLAALLKAEGLKVKILRAGTVDPTKREDWIAENGPKVDVMISHPQLVSTGLDFFDKSGTYNFPTIVFYEGDYQTNRVRQAGRRHWRIGQPEPCETYYLYYEQTMQHRQIKHVGAKFAAAKQLEGKFSEEGLAAISGDGGEQMALAKSLVARIEDVRGDWAKLRTDQRKKVRHVADTGALARLRLAADQEPELLTSAQAVAVALMDVDLDDLGFDDEDDDDNFEHLAAPAAPEPQPEPAAKPKRAKAKPKGKSATPAGLAAMFEDLAALGIDLDDLD